MQFCSLDALRSMPQKYAAEVRRWLLACRETGMIPPDSGEKGVVVAAMGLESALASALNDVLSWQPGAVILPWTAAELRCRERRLSRRIQVFLFLPNSLSLFTFSSLTG